METELEMAQRRVEEAQKEVQNAQGELLRLKNAAAEVEIEEVEPAEEPDVPQRRAAKVRGVQPAPAGCRTICWVPGMACSQSEASSGVRHCLF